MECKKLITLCNVHGMFLFYGLSDLRISMVKYHLKCA